MTDERCTWPEGSGPQPARSESGPRLARHLVACSPCGTQLDALAAERDVLVRLHDRPSDVTGRPFVERVLAASADEGRQQLADLLYELARACIALSPDEGLGHPVLYRLHDEPQPSVRLVEDIRTLGPRMTALDGTPTVADLSEASLAGFRAADRCLQVLRAVEDETDRFAVAAGVIQLGLGNPGEALPFFERVVRSSSYGAAVKSAKRNQLGTLIRLGRYDDAIDLADQMLVAGEDQGWALCHLAITHAWRKDRASFEAAASRFAASGSGAVMPDPGWWKSFIDYQAPWIAGQLDLEVAEVRRAFRVDELAEGPS